MLIATPGKMIVGSYRNGLIGKAISPPSAAKMRVEGSR